MKVSGFTKIVNDIEIADATQAVAADSDWQVHNLSVTGTLTAGAFSPSSITLPGSISGTTTLQASSIASGTLTLPAATDTLLGKATADILTNKTLDTAGTGNVLKINGSQLTAVTGSGGVLVEQTSPTLITPNIGSASADLIKQRTSTGAFAIVDNNSVSHFFISASSPFTNTFIQGNGAGVVFLGSANKTNVDDVTGNISMGGSSSGTTVIQPTAVASGTLTLPAATDTLVGKATTDTLTNKTLTTPVMTSPNVTSGGVQMAETTAVAFAGGSGGVYSKSSDHRLHMGNGGTDDTILGAATTDTLTNKTFDSGGTGNTLKIAGTSVSGVLGSGSVVLASASTGSGNIVFATSPVLTTPSLGAATATAITGLTSAITPNAAGGTTLGSAALPFSSAFIGTAGTNNIQITGTATGARTLTIPDANSVSVVASTAPSHQVANAVSLAGAVSYIQLASTDLSDTASVVLLTSTQTLTNKRVTPRQVSMADATSVTPTSDTADINTFTSTQGAGTLTVGAPSGTPTDGQKLVLRLKSTNAQTYSFNGTYAFSTTVTAPTTLAAGKTDYLGLMWNATNTKWDVVAVDQGH